MTTRNKLFGSKSNKKITKKIQVIIKMTTRAKLFGNKATKNETSGTSYDIIEKSLKNKNQIRIPLSKKYISMDKTRTGEVTLTPMPDNKVGISLYVSETKPISIDGKTVGTTKINKNRSYIRSVKTKTQKDNTARFLYDKVSEGNYIINK